MKALYLRHPDKRNDELALISNALTDLDTSELLVFAQTGGTSGYPMSFDQVGSMYCALPAGRFNQILVGTTLHLFRNPWSMAMLSQLYRALVPGGTLVVPYFDRFEAKRKGYWSRAALKWFFKRRVRQHADCDFLIVNRKRDMPAVNSVLFWYFHHRGTLLTTCADLIAARSSLDAEVVRAHCRPMLLHDRAIRIDGLALSDLPKVERLLDVMKTEEYLISGVGYKSALLRHIAKEHLQPNRPLRFLDHGGGGGFLAAEMLLQPDLPVAKSVCCDTSLTMSMIARQMHDGMRDCLGDRFFFELARSSEFTYDDSYDLISFISALMYMPREEAREALSRAFDALRSGGVLVIHENIKSPSYKRDYDLMFTVEELESLLKPFGQISYYLSTATVAVTREQAGKRSVFRAMQKR